MSTPTLQPAPGGAATVDLRIGQRVRLQDYAGRQRRLTGRINSLITEGRELMADVALDTPLVLSQSDGTPDITLHRQYVPAHELAPYDAREEAIDALLAAARAAHACILQDRTSMADSHTGADGLDEDGAAGCAEYDQILAQLTAAMAKATGGAA